MQTATTGELREKLREELHEIPTPSQAEGEDDDREHINIPRTTPSQAEGDEKTVDEDLKLHEND